MIVVLSASIPLPEYIWKVDPCVGSFPWVGLPHSRVIFHYLHEKKILGEMESRSLKQCSHSWPLRRNQGEGGLKFWWGNLFLNDLLRKVSKLEFLDFHIFSNNWEVGLVETSQFCSELAAAMIRFPNIGKITSFHLEGLGRGIHNLKLILS